MKSLRQKFLMKISKTYWGIRGGTFWHTPDYNFQQFLIASLVINIFFPQALRLICSEIQHRAILSGTPGASKHIFEKVKDNVTKLKRRRCIRTIQSPATIFEAGKIFLCDWFRILHSHIHLFEISRPYRRHTTASNSDKFEILEFCVFFFAFRLPIVRLLFLSFFMFISRRSHIITDSHPPMSIDT